MAYSTSQSDEQKKRLQTLRSQLYGKESLPSFLTQDPTKSPSQNKKSDPNAPQPSKYSMPHGVYSSNTQYYSDTSHLKKDLIKIALLGGFAIVCVVAVYFLMQDQFNQLFSFGSKLKFK